MDNSEVTEEINILENDSEPNPSDIDGKVEENIKETISRSKDLQNKKEKQPNQNQTAKYTKFPFARVKALMKMDPEVELINRESVYLVSKATELFIDCLCREAGRQLAGHKRKTLMQRDIEVAIESVPHFCFLDGALE